MARMNGFLSGNYSHAELVDMAASYLRGTLRCRPVFAEKSAWTTSERPDAFGVNSDGSVLIECKTSIEDFRADSKKPFRINPRLGMGRLRYYLVNQSILEQVKERLPSGWGLLVPKRGFASKIVDPSVFNQNSNAECLIMRSAWLANTDQLPRREAIKACAEFMKQMEELDRLNPMESN